MVIVILRTGDAIAEIAERRGQFARWIEEGVGSAWPFSWREHDVRSDDALPEVEKAAAFVITGSSSSVTERAPWMLRVEEYIRAIVAAEVPLLGICFGHQLIAQALGGQVSRNPHGREIGTVSVEQVEVTPDPLFLGLSPRFQVNATHVDTVAQLPEGARILASTPLEPTAAYAWGETTRGVQFHPEIDAEVMRGYVRARAHLIEQEQMCSKTIYERVSETPDGATILKNFVQHFVLSRKERAA